MVQDVSKHKSPQFTQALTFVPIDLNDDTDVQILLEQRKICGWDDEMKSIERWRDQLARDVKWLWWITLPAQPPTSTSVNNDVDNEKNNTTNNHRNSATIKVGHVGLAAEVYPLELSLASPDHSSLTVSSFFILPSYRTSGLGRVCFYEIENKARQIPNCQWITLNTIDRRYQFDEGPEWQGLLIRAGRDVKQSDIVLEDWYARMGYVKFRTVPRYPLPGMEERLLAVFMRKSIR